MLLFQVCVTRRKLLSRSLEWKMQKCQTTKTRNTLGLWICSLIVETWYIAYTIKSAITGVINNKHVNLLIYFAFAMLSVKTYVSPQNKILTSRRYPWKVSWKRKMTLVFIYNTNETIFFRMFLSYITDCCVTINITNYLGFAIKLIYLEKYQFVA